jgi:3-methyladenine DNA glycosylase/8-oxoguanine DNA glycosylase
LSRLRYNRRQAVAHLRANCPALAALIRSQGAFRIEISPRQNLFCSLSRAVIYQQLSGKAAATIHGRFEALFPGNQPDPVTAASMSVASLRAVGLSNNKALSVLDLAAHANSRLLPSHRKQATMSDQEIIEALCHVRGIGPWTAQMHLIFVMGRADVMPATDLGVQKGVQYVYGLEALPSPDEVIDRTQHLAPYRSAASWYFWRAADTILPA